MGLSYKDTSNPSRKTPESTRSASTYSVILSTTFFFSETPCSNLLLGPLFSPNDLATLYPIVRLAGCLPITN